MGAIGSINNSTSVVESSEKGAANGVASLDGGAKIPPGQLPTGFGGNKWTRNFWTYNMVTAAGYTWDGVTVNAPGVGILNERHRLMAFDDGQGAGTAEGSYVNFMLPLEYTAGNNIKVSANIVTNTTGNAVFKIGVTQPDGSNNLGGSGETEWVSQTVAGVVGYRDMLVTFTFDGTNMSPGDSIAIMIYRDADNASDTLTGDCWLHTFEIEEV